MLVLALAGCGAEQGASGQDTTRQEQGAPEQGGNGTTGPEKNAHEQGSDEQAYTPPKNLLPPPEPARAPPLEEEPAGRVFEVGTEPEGIVADHETGLVAVGLRDPDELALVDGGSGNVVRKVELPGSARHLNIAAPGGPVLVPGEPSDSLAQVSLPDGEVVETPVDNFPHDAASTPEGRILVVSEAASTATVIEGRSVGSPYGLAVDRERSHLWVTLTAENRLVQYALEHGAPRGISSFPTVRQPNSVTVDPESGRVFVAGREEGVLQILEPGSGE